MTALKIEDTLNGGYAGLYSEVVTHDCYKLQSIKFSPDLIFDFGANIGIFARYAQQLWPDAKIVSVEPNPDNVAVYKQFTQDTVLLNVAIGKGELYHNLGARNGSGEVYISKGLGYPDGGDEKSEIPTKMPAEIIKRYWRPGMKAIVKMDIEGGENIIWGHPTSMAALKEMDFLAFEVHFYAATHDQLQGVVNATMDALNSFRDTHEVLIENVHFWAWRK